MIKNLILSSLRRVRNKTWQFCLVQKRSLINHQPPYWQSDRNTFKLLSALFSRPKALGDPITEFVCHPRRVERITIMRLLWFFSMLSVTPTAFSQLTVSNQSSELIWGPYR